MLTVETDGAGTRTYRLPRALVAVAVEVFRDNDQTAAVLSLAHSMSLSDVHTVEQIALNGSHDDAVRFARKRMRHLSVTQ